MRTHRIDIAVTNHGPRGPVYQVGFAGEILIAACRCPALDACRALLARGITGRLEVWRKHRTAPDMRVDIARGARFTVIENDSESSLRLAKWVPPPQIGVSRRRGEPKPAQVAA